MKRIILAAILAGATGVAVAGGNSNSNNSDNGGNATATASVGNVSATGGSASATGGSVRNEIENRNTNTNINTNVNSLSNKQGQAQGQRQGQVQGQGQSQSTRNSNNARQSTEQSVTFNSPKQAVPASAPSMPATSTCMVGISGGVGFTGFGASAGTYVEDKTCRKLELARFYAGLGDTETAYAILNAVAGEYFPAPAEPRAASADKDVFGADYSN